MKDSPEKDLEFTPTFGIRWRRATIAANKIAIRKLYRWNDETEKDIIRLEEQLKHTKEDG